MTKLADASVDFARAHIEAYYDSDFFPKPEEYQAIWAKWDTVKKALLESNVEALKFEPPRCLPARKSRGGFRMVHQLEPFSALAYTALAHMVAPTVEASRQAANVVFSYRIVLSANSFFGESTNYSAFVDRLRDLAGRHAFVFRTDIADFYNRIYIHRVQNNIESADTKLSATGTTVENFLMRLNGKVSQGIPVGPAASIVMAETVMTDIDQLLSTKGFEWARYVDDIYIFGDSERTLNAFQEDLVQYLFDIHRLQTSDSKTSLRTGAELRETLSVPEEHSSRSLLDLARAVGDYGQSYSQKDLDDLTQKYLKANPDPRPIPDNPFRRLFYLAEREEAAERETIRDGVLEHMLSEGIRADVIDLGMVRYALRNARAWRSSALFEPVLSNLPKLRPVLAEVFLYLQSVTTPALVETHRGALRALLTSETFGLSRFAQLWTYWYVSSHKELVDDALIGQKVWSEAEIEWQMRAARNSGNVAQVKRMKASIGDLGLWSRRAVLMASAMMPSGERKPWLQSVTAHDVIEKVIIEWAAEQP